MSDLLQTGAAWLHAARHAFLSHAVTYCRGAEQIVVLATVGQQTFEIVSDQGVETVQSRDFIIRAADLVLGGAVARPVPGDRIREDLAGGAVLVCEVMALPGIPAYQWSDPAGTSYRVHTKVVAEEPS